MVVSTDSHGPKQKGGSTPTSFHTSREMETRKPCAALRKPGQSKGFYTPLTGSLSWISTLGFSHRDSTYA